MAKTVKKAFIIEISDENVLNNLERLTYEENRTKELLVAIAAANDDSFNENYYNWLYNKYTNIVYEYEKAKKEFAATYLGKIREHQIDWNLDFSTKKVTVLQYCDCDDIYGDHDATKNQMF